MEEETKILESEQLIEDRNSYISELGMLQTKIQEQTDVFNTAQRQLNELQTDFNNKYSILTYINQKLQNLGFDLDALMAAMQGPGIVEVPVEDVTSEVIEEEVESEIITEE